jgi:hypothetical protein
VCDIIGWYAVAVPGVEPTLACSGKMANGQPLRSAACLPRCDGALSRDRTRLARRVPFFRISRLLMPARAAVAVEVRSRAIQASTIVKYGWNGLNGHQTEKCETRAATDFIAQVITSPRSSPSAAARCSASDTRPAGCSDPTNPPPARSAVTRASRAGRSKSPSRPAFCR